ncbi:GRP family sugar transporter [Nicoliella spurrieriana]|uniref:GRP family sugar transporter n=1 Tax=Nicoliella spurrieriana TaxID=2925830 RepID=A0A976RRA9_9LACO|nr:GRP family sugar transporter [Nicoliella spurrieriana]UQS86404.1 GRP family sugar transporter [Nicoliella spurrieriana]
MNTVALLIGLGPLFGWGLFPTIASKIGGKPNNQILGTTIGTLFLAILFALIRGLKIPTGSAFILSMLSGIGWDFGQILAFKSYQLIGSSRTMPITTALQLIVTSLWGVFALGNWPSINEKIVGIAALIVIIIGAIMTSWQEKRDQTSSANLSKATVLLVIGVFGYWFYSAGPQAANVDGVHAFLPQAIGMVLGAVIYNLFSIKKENVFKEKVSYMQIFAGFFFGFAALTYLVSAQPNMNGLATGFVLSQTSVIVATITGIFFLNQRKTGKELAVTVIGLILILISATVTAFL